MAVPVFGLNTEADARTRTGDSFIYEYANAVYSPAPSHAIEGWAC
jgi:hypothetical protein